MEPKTTTILVLACLLFLFVIAYIIMRRIYNEQTGSMWNTIHKLHEENSSLLDLYIEYKGKCKQQSKRIAELIELCNKLQPDLVAQHDVKYKDDWFSQLKKSETFYYYYTFGNCIMEGSKPMNYKMDGGMYRPRKTREEAEADKQFYNSLKQK